MNHNIIAMRKLILLPLLFVCAGLFSAQKSVNNRHVSLKECNNDTLLYTKTNFLQNKQNYVGLPVDSLFKDLDIPIEYFGTITPYREDGDKISGMIIGYIPVWKEHQYKKSNKSFYVLYIDFKKPYAVYDKEWISLKRNKGVRWVKEYRDFFKDFIIEDILIFDRGKGVAVK